MSWSGRDEALDSYPESAQHLYASPDGSALRALGVGGTPAAVILGLNGKVAAGPTHGIEAITELLGALIQAITVNAVTGRLHGPQETRALGGADTGDAHLPPEGTVLPDVMVRAEDGSESTLTQALRSLNVSDSVPVVAWRDTCPYCGEIAPDLQQFSQRSEVVLLVNEQRDAVERHGDPTRRWCWGRLGVADAHRSSPRGWHLYRHPTAGAHGASDGGPTSAGGCTSAATATRSGRREQRHTLPLNASLTPVGDMR